MWLPQFASDVLHGAAQRNEKHTLFIAIVALVSTTEPRTHLRPNNCYILCVRFLLVASQLNHWTNEYHPIRFSLYRNSEATRRNWISNALPLGLIQQQKRQTKLKEFTEIFSARKEREAANPAQWIQKVKKNKIENFRVILNTILFSTPNCDNRIFFFSWSWGLFFFIPIFICFIIFVIFANDQNWEDKANKFQTNFKSKNGKKWYRNLIGFAEEIP